MVRISQVPQYSSATALSKVSFRFCPTSVRPAGVYSQCEEMKQLPHFQRPLYWIVQIRVFLEDGVKGVGVSLYLGKLLPTFIGRAFPNSKSFLPRLRWVHSGPRPLVGSWEIHSTHCLPSTFFYNSFPWPLPMQLLRRVVGVSNMVVPFFSDLWFNSRWFCHY